jgi:hypothetical protein
MAEFDVLSHREARALKPLPCHYCGRVIARGEPMIWETRRHLVTRQEVKLPCHVACPGQE